MKKKIISLIMIIAVLASCIIPASAAASSGGQRTKDITAYVFSMDDSKKLTCLFTDQLPSVPYIEVTDYLNTIYKIPFTAEKNADGSYTYADKNGSFIADPEKDTVRFDDYETVVFNDAKETEGLHPAYIQNDSDYQHVGEITPADFSLKGYGIDLIEDNGRLYFPLTTIVDIFSSTYLSARYLDGSLYFYQPMDPNGVYFETKDYYDSLDREKDVVEYTYNELCFMMDHFYGRPSRCEFSPLIAEKGFDKALEATAPDIKQKLLSADRVEFFTGLLCLDTLMNDGGHTIMSMGAFTAMESHPESALAVALNKLMQDNSNPDYGTILSAAMNLTVRSMTVNQLIPIREESFARYTEVKKWDKCAYYEIGETGIFSFDEFLDEVVEPFKWSLDHAKDNGIKNFVLDLTVNSGGSSGVAGYMSSVICNNSEQYYKCITDGNRLKTQLVVDRNLDGKFDEADNDVKYDFNFAVLCTGCSYSCGNFLPCYLQANGVAIGGMTSGGGTCMEAFLNYPSDGSYAMSHMLMFTGDDGKDFDMGAQPDFGPDSASEEAFVELYDVNKINKGIAEFYGTPYSGDIDLPEISADALSESQVVADSDDSPLLTIAKYGIAALAVICIVVFIIVVLKKKKKTAPAEETISAADNAPDEEAPAESAAPEAPADDTKAE